MSGRFVLARLCLPLLAFIPLGFAQNVVSTIAGTGFAGYNGDAVAATSAALNQPSAVAVDATGNIYVADRGNHRIRRVSAAGQITTTAGTGAAAFSGDGGFPTTADLSFPQGVAVDSAGRVYIADTGNHRVRRIDADGRIRTVAGNGTVEPILDGGQATTTAVPSPTTIAVDAGGVLYIVSGSAIRRVSSEGVITTFASNLVNPRAIFTDALGSLYLASQDTITRLPTGGVVAGTGSRGFAGDGGPAVSALLNAPAGVAVDLAGNIYIADTGNQRIRRVRTDGNISTIAGAGAQGFSGDGGAATGAAFSAPTALAFDAAGNLLVVDSNNHRVRRISTPGACLFSLSPTSFTVGVASGTRSVALSVAAGCAWTATSSVSWMSLVPGSSSGTGSATVVIFFSENTAQQVRSGVVTIAGIPVIVTQDAAVCTYAINPTSANVSAAGASGSVTVTAPPGCAWIATSSVTFITITSGQSGTGMGTLFYTVAPNTGASSPARSGTLTIAGLTFTVNQESGECRYTISPTSQLRSGSSGTGTVTVSVLVGCGWAVTVSDSWIRIVSGFSGSGSGAVTYSVTTNTGPSRTGTITIAGQVYTLTQEQSLSRTPGIIFTYAGDGRAGYGGDGGPATAASFRAPTAVALDRHGHSYIADSANHRVRRVDPRGVVTTVAGTGTPGFSGDGGPAADAQLNTPIAVAVDQAGNLFIADSLNYRIRRVTPGGTISTFAGTGNPGFSGDFGQATNAQMREVLALAVDNQGNLLLADRVNNRIRRVSATSGTIQTVAGNGQLGFSGDNGSATSASLALPEGVVVDSAGNIYIADVGNFRVRRVSTGNIITTVAGNGALGFSGDGGPATSAMISSPRAIAIDSTGALLIADSDNQRIRKVGLDGVIRTVIGTGTEGASGDDGPPAAATLRAPRGMAVDPDGHLFLADLGNNKVRVATQAVCTFNLVPSFRSYVSSGGTGGFEVFTTGDCSWIARSEATWILLTNSGRGTGNGVVFFSFTANTSTQARSGRIVVNDLNFFDVNQAGIPDTTPTISFEPQLRRTLAPGFYILEATLARTDTLGGFYGMEVIASAGDQAGGFNLGGGLHAGAASPGFGAFLMLAQQTVTATLNAQLASGAMVTMRFLDSNRRQVGNSVSGLPPLTLRNTFPPGFYIVEVYNSGLAPFNYQLGLAAEVFNGGVNTGGYLGPGSVGFGAFYVPVEQEVTMKMYGRATYGLSGAGDLTLTLRDANRNVIATVTPP
jgi:sugar lactone lactonase YvrE